MLKNLFTPSAERSSAAGLQRGADWGGAVCGWGRRRGGVSERERISQGLHLCICSGNTGTPAVGTGSPDCSTSTNINDASAAQRIHLARAVPRSRCVGCMSQSRGQTFLLFISEPALCFLAQDDPRSDLWVPWWPWTCHRTQPVSSAELKGQKAALPLNSVYAETCSQ